VGVLNAHILCTGFPMVNTVRTAPCRPIRHWRDLPPAPFRGVAMAIEFRPVMIL
jgi:hypothetical protein